MKFFKSSITAIILCTAMPLCGAKKTTAATTTKVTPPVTIPKQTTPAPQQKVLPLKQPTSAPKTYKEILDTIKNKMNPADIWDNTNKHLKDLFIAAIKSYATEAHLTAIEFEALLQAGRNFHALFTGDKTNDAQTMVNVNNQITRAKNDFIKSISEKPATTKPSVTKSVVASAPTKLVETKPDTTNAVSNIDKEAIIQQLENQLHLPVDSTWHKKVDDLLFDLSMVDRTLAREYSQKIRKKTADITTKVEPAIEKPVTPVVPPVISKPTLTSVGKVSPQQKKPLKITETSTIGLIDKNDVVQQLNAQLLLPIDDTWNAKVDDLLFDLATVDRTLANEYSQKIREKMATMAHKTVESITEKPVTPTKTTPSTPTQEKSPIKEEPIISPVSGEPGMVKGTARGPGSGPRPKQTLPVKSEKPTTPEKLEKSQKSPAEIEEQLKQLIQEPAGQRAPDWLQTVNELIFALSAFDTTKAGMYIEEVYAVKSAKSTKGGGTTAAVAQKEPDRPQTFGGNKAPFLSAVKKLADNKILESFNKYLLALPDSWVKGPEGGNPAQWWTNDIQVFEKAIKEKGLEVRTPEEIEKEVAASTTKEAMAREINKKKDEEITLLKTKNEQDKKEAIKNITEPLEKSKILKEFDQKQKDEIAKIKASSLSENEINEIKKKIEAEVQQFSGEKVTQKVQAKIARVRAEKQAAEEGLTLDEVDELTKELADEAKNTNPSASEQDIQKFVDRNLVEAKNRLVKDKQADVLELTKELAEEIKKSNASLDEKAIQSLVREKLPQAKKDLAAKKETERQALTKEIKQHNSSLDNEAIEKLVRAKLKQIRTNLRTQREEQYAKESAIKELTDLTQDIENLLNDPKGDSVWVINIKGKIKELNKLDPTKAKQYREQFLEIMPKEKLDLKTTTKKGD